MLWEIVVAMMAGVALGAFGMVVWLLGYVDDDEKEEREFIERMMK